MINSWNKWSNFPAQNFCCFSIVMSMSINVGFKGTLCALVMHNCTCT